ncbi:unnamed protein product, partial [Vitis vinifera]|uniref:Non-specific serine/threonine protein kinase n=1 Tax=Vitis vinifera TaxID=29760 RepID=D7T7S2_VITVI
MPFTKVKILYLSYNQFTGSVPDLIGFSSLRVLYLGYNQLNGTLPTSIGHLTKLQWLDIGSNSLQGVISEAHLFHLSDLHTLDLSSNSLTFNMSLEWVPPFQLFSLALTSCQLGPHFPSWLRTQKQLKDLDISNSNISDVIPNWFWNLTSPIYTFNISNNQIIGNLPNLTSKFDQPLYIDMSSNYLEGSIPQLPSDLALLDLSNNKFSGSISLLCTVSKSYLVYLDLSNNLLSGHCSWIHSWILGSVWNSTTQQFMAICLFPIFEQNKRLALCDYNNKYGSTMEESSKLNGIQHRFISYFSMLWSIIKRGRNGCLDISNSILSTPHSMIIVGV